jgi:hypothetical protein
MPAVPKIQRSPSKVDCTCTPVLVKVTKKPDIVTVPTNGFCRAANYDIPNNLRCKYKHVENCRGISNTGRVLR